MDIFWYIKIGKRIRKAHKAIFTHKTMVLWYKGNPIIGTMHDGLWYQQDINGMLEQLMFQKQVTHVSFLPSPPNEDRERTSLSHHRWDSWRAQGVTHRPLPRSYHRNRQSWSPSAAASTQRVIRRRQDRLVQNTQRYGIHYQKFINQNQYGRKVRNNHKERLGGII